MRQCFVWSSTGRLIGGADAFTEHAKDVYNVETDWPVDKLPQVLEENIATVQSVLAESTDSYIAVEPDGQSAY